MARTSPEKVNRLTSQEQWTLGQWLSDTDIAPGSSFGQLAITATELLKKDVTAHNIRGILLMIGKEIPPIKRDVENGKAIRLLAQQVNAVCVALNIPLVAGFEDLLP